MNLSKLDALLDKKLGEDWHLLEMETISMEIGAILDDYSFVQIIILKALQEHPDLVLGDVDYFLRLVEVANGHVPDPHYHDIPTSLELDFALKEAELILGNKMEKTKEISNIIRYVLNNEGHGQAASPRLAKYSGKPPVQTEFTKAYEMYAKDMAYGN